MSEEGARPRVLHVTRNLPPLVGGMERLNWHMAEELAKVADVRVVGPQSSAAVAPDGIDVREAPLKPLWRFLLHAQNLARREAASWRPDIVLAGSGLTAPLASDPETGGLSDALGIWTEKSMYGRTYMGMVRTTMLIGADGRIERIWPKVKVKGHAAEVLEAVRAL